MTMKITIKLNTYTEDEQESLRRLTLKDVDEIVRICRHTLEWHLWLVIGEEYSMT